MLTDEDVARFHRDGYVTLPGAYDELATARIAAWTEELAGAPEVPGRHWVYREESLTVPGERVLSRIENFCPFHEGFDELLRSGDLPRWVERLLGEPAVLFKEKINFKMPGGDGFRAHQDIQAGWDRYAPFHITAMVSIDPTTPENGCLEIAPGAAAGNRLLGEMWRPLTEAEVPDERYVPVPTRPGDVVLFDSFVPHRSAPNLTDAPRRVLYVTYNRLSDGDQRARYYADKHESYPPDVERDPAREYRFRV